ncbi:MAG TPA: UvrB/UvrC motif-containing protein [Gemmatimonadaceae bacterium]|nr:UvrB/UvrC motif-containing protein [Gemmatimonadaceae bacterium]
MIRGTPRLEIQPTTDAQLAIMKSTVRDAAKDRPGVYRMLSSDGEIVYVGKSKRVRSRLLSYFRCAYPEEKGARILRSAEKIEWDYTPSEFAALLQELHMIKRFRPRYNVAMKRDGRNYSFIKLTKGPASKLMVVRGPTGEDADIYYGPFVGAMRVEEALRELSDVLMLRDCRSDLKMFFNDQTELFQLARTPGCIRHEIGKCLGPCVGGCTETQYNHQVSLARAFLDGADDGPMNVLRTQMEKLSDELQFERAAVYRDKLERLEALRAQFGRLRFAVENLSFVYTVPGHDGEDKVYLIRRGVVRAELSKPRSTKDRRSMKQLVDDIFSQPVPSNAQVPTHEIDELLLLSSWFRRFPSEMKRTRQVS